MMTTESQNNLDEQGEFQWRHRQVGEFLEQVHILLEAEFKRNADHQLLQELLRRYKKIQKKWQEQTFQIAVIALAKTGKSTFINALLGDEYLPASNTPETARIVRIRHASQAPAGELHDGTKICARGAKDINSFLRKLNKVARETARQASGQGLVLEAPLIAIQELSLGNQQFDILDTPGPNEAGTDQMRVEVERILDEADAIIYLLDYTKLKTTDEQSLFHLLADMRPQLLQRCADRLFFAVNKIDVEDRNGLSADDTQKYVAALLRNTIPQISVEPGRILPLSANQALLARMVLAGKSSEEALSDFKVIAFGKVAGRRRNEAECKEEAPTILNDSRLCAVETEVLSYICNHRGRLLHQSLLEDLERCLQKFDNHLLTAQGTLYADRSELLGRLASLKGDMAEISAGLQQLSAKTEASKKELENWVRNRFDRHQAEAIEMIRDAVATEPPKKRKGYFRTLWSDIRVLLTGEDTDPHLAEQRVKHVNKQIEDHLHSEFVHFQNELEQEAHERQHRLFEELQHMIDPLARSMERKVNQALSISLTPVPVRLPEPSLGDFHRNIDGRLGRFIAKSKTTEQYIDTERRLVSAGGFCNPATYQDHRITREREVTKLGISVTALIDFWSQIIRDRTEVSVKTAKLLVEQMINQIVARAKKELEDYSASFMTTIEREIGESESSKEQRDLRLQELDGRRKAINTLLMAFRNFDNENEAIRAAYSKKENLSTPVQAEYVDIAIITILPEEFNAVVQKLTDCRPAEGTADAPNTHAWHIGTITSTNHVYPYRVAVALAGRPGNVSGATAVIATVKRWNPRYIMLVGIAGGFEVDGMEKGDVVVSTNIWGYEYGKLEKQFHPRPDFIYSVDSALLTTAQAISAKGGWNQLAHYPKPDGSKGFRIKFGPIASGEKVVDDPTAEFFQNVLKAWPKLAAVEMEGVGAAAAIDALQAEGRQIGFIMIRGISDLPRSLSNASAGQQEVHTEKRISGQSQERDKWKEFASHSAASFAIDLVQDGWPVPPREETSRHAPPLRPSIAHSKDSARRSA